MLHHKIYFPKVRNFLWTKVNILKRYFKLLNTPQWVNIVSRVIKLSLFLFLERIRSCSSVILRLTNNKLSALYYYIIIIIISEGKVLRTRLRRWYRSLKIPPSPRKVNRTIVLYVPYSFRTVMWVVIHLQKSAVKVFRPFEETQVLCYHANPF